MLQILSAHLANPTVTVTWLPIAQLIPQAPPSGSYLTAGHQLVQAKHALHTPRLPLTLSRPGRNKKRKKDEECLKSRCIGTVHAGTQGCPRYGQGEHDDRSEGAK